MATEMKSLSELQEELIRATDRYEEAKKEERRASREATNLLNTLNGLQKRMDAEMERLRGAAPRDSDWKRPRHGE